ncbi:MAG: alpha/beta hydrolase, partial [Actinomycetota bacterium]
DAATDTTTTAPPTTVAEPETSDDDTAATGADDGVELIDIQTDAGIVPIAVIENGPLPELPAGAVERVVEHEGHDVFTIEVPGEGQPVVLLHGFPDNLHLYDNLYPLLAGRRVIAFDFVGWGRSAKPLPVEEYEYSTAAQVAEVRAVFDAYGLEDAVLVVHDQSAPVGIDLLREGEPRVQRMVFLNGFYSRTESLFPPKGIEVHSDAQLHPVELALQRDPGAIEAFHRFQMDEFIVSAENEQEMIDRLWNTFAEARPAFVALTNRLVSEVITRFETVEDLPDITIPIDIVYGAQDPYLTVGTAIEFDGWFPDSTLTVLDDAGHFVQIDRPDAVAAAILADR